MTKKEKRELFNEIVALKGRDFIRHYENDEISSWGFGYEHGVRLMTGDGGAKLMLEKIKEINADS